MRYLAIDLGGTKVAAALIDTQGKILYSPGIIFRNGSKQTGKLS